MKRFFLILLGMFMSATMLTGCGYNEIQTLDESTKAAWSEVLNQYQRRNDLIPNVVNSVKGEADFEKSITRIEGGIMILCYVAYTVVLIYNI